MRVHFWHQHLADVPRKVSLCRTLLLHKVKGSTSQERLDSSAAAALTEMNIKCFQSMIECGNRLGGHVYGTMHILSVATILLARQSGHKA